MMDTCRGRYSLHAAEGGGMRAKETCRYCYGTGMIQCTTGWNGEMAVSCSCRREKTDSHEDAQMYALTENK
jgi:hypothetical protein